MGLNLPALVLLGTMPLTSYQAKESQTDSTPFTTSIDHHVHPFGAAVSPDLLRSGEACYGDVLLVEGYGLRVVNDVMGEYTYRTKPPTKQSRQVDIFVTSQAEEALVNVQRRQIWVLRSPVRACNRTEAMTMGMANAKKIRSALDAFRKQNGKEPNQEEFKDLIMGRLSRKASHISPAYEISPSDRSARGE